MPQAIASRKQAPAIIGVEHGAVGVEIRDVGKYTREAQFFGAQNAAATFVLQGAKAARKRHLLRIVDRLVAKNQDGKPVHAGTDVRRLLRCQWRAQVKALNLGDKFGMDGFDAHVQTGEIAGDSID